MVLEGVVNEWMRKGEIGVVTFGLGFESRQRAGLGGRICAVPRGMGVLVARHTLGRGGIAHKTVVGICSGLDPLAVG